MHIGIGVGYENGRHSTLGQRSAGSLKNSRMRPLPSVVGVVVTPNCLGNPPVDRDRRSAHPSPRAYNKPFCKKSAAIISRKDGSIDRKGILSHCGMMGNKSAGTLSKAGSDLPQPDLLVCYQSVKSVHFQEKI
ncbi:hypothetical protein TNCV_1816621 [Trichonephila clavipes]|nr:hypothetical protein TNCV_1816621 [Trichonephila clavipes]